MPQKVAEAQFFQEPIRQGGVYAAVYVSRENFGAVLSPAGHLRPRVYRTALRNPGAYARNLLNFQIRRMPYKKFVVIRDLRDTLVSDYFGIKISHPLVSERISKYRTILKNLTTDQGLIYLMDEVTSRYAEIQASWMNDDALIIKYEDLVADEHGTFEQIVNYCEIDVDRKYLHQIVSNNSFEVVTGRKRGEEDVQAHQRKGIVGDWRNYFSGQVKEEFKKRFGDVLIKTGYERDLHW